MGELLTISPPLHFPKGVPFKIVDPHNGPIRGEWWWRDGPGTLHGPYTCEEEARDQMFQTPIEPIEDVTHHWWWKDHSGHNHGPYRTIADANGAIRDSIMKAYMA